MACLNITPGLFFNASPGVAVWEANNATFTTPDGVVLTNTVGGASDGCLIDNGSDTLFFPRPSGGSTRFAAFGSPRNYVAVLTIQGGVGPVMRTVSIVDVTGSTIVSQNVLMISADSTISLPSIEPSQGSGDVCAVIGANGAAPLGQVFASIHRSDNGATLASAVPFSPTMQVIGSATTTELQILEGSTVRASAPLPAGECLVTDDPVVFADAIIGPGVPPALGTSVEQATIQNNGENCLTVSAIGNVAPFSVVATTPALPAILDVGDTLVVDIRFSPAAVGNFDEDLPITRTPAAGDDHIRCQAEARAPILDLSFAGTLAFGIIPVGTSRTLALAISNTGEADVNVTVAASPAGIPFSWPALTATIAPGASSNLNVTFTPAAEGAANRVLQFTSTAPGSPHNVNLTGTGCIARARIEVTVPPGPVIQFGEVQRGFRMVRLVTVRNTGNGPLNFRATTAGSALFGLQREGDSITAPLATANFTVNPVTACGPLATGSGEVLFAVTFFADAVPGIVTGQLTIDNHNDATAAATMVFDLEATVTAAINADAQLVLDRSGSMSEVSGARTKIEVARDAAQLFIQLGRPDVDDRIGLVRFNNVPEVFSSIQAITSANQPTLVAAISPTSLDPNGSTAVAGGVITALRDLNANPRATVPAVLNKAVIVLTDGHDNAPYLNPDDNVTYSLLGEDGNTPLSVPAGIRLYGIGIGNSIDSGRLGQLALATGGEFLHVLDFGGLDFFKLEKHFTQIYMDTVDLATIVDPTFVIQPADRHEHEFDILRGDVATMVVIFDRDGIRLPFHLEAPNGELVSLTSIPAGYQIRPGITRTARFLEVRFPQHEPDRYAGKWHAVITHDRRACHVRVEPQAATWRDRVPNAESPAGRSMAHGHGFQGTDCKENYDAPIMYGIAIGAGSNFRMFPYVEPGIVSVGEPIRLNALISEFGLPVTGCTVTVRSTAPDGTQHTFTLRDDGAHEDGDVDDGDYGWRFMHTYVEGPYEFLFRATGLTRDNEPVVREATRSKYVQGRVPLVPPGGGLVPGGGGGGRDECCSKLERWLRIIAIGMVFLVILMLLVWLALT